ncbi:MULTISPECIES: DUF4340 domain-containing protein [Thiorhodovibrio]|uniref:DUF4340 domain-containing protein n=1 Tax=Thiorhodovibrio TaxID=61593 RepID=UPI001912153E|nr:MULTISPECIES: DUF4340 domain-containing protein [Thiorhodovibrio]MBK5969641.1 hypothetical protein [Thiorhodovibrio winogradskyi]WPL14710.1 hypothetical protein Thiosp_04565 [Thiorhodovibrio litoralis]
MAETTRDKATAEAFERAAPEDARPSQAREPASSSSGWPAALRTPLVIGLGALLGVQLLLAAVTSGGSHLAPTATNTALAAFDAKQIDSIEIATPEGETALILSRTGDGDGDGDGWDIPRLGDFPADSTRVDQLLEALAGLQRSLPIATSEAARERFKVADDAFAESITLKRGDDKVATLILGDSPGFRRRYLRPADDDGVYDVRFDVFNLSDQPGEWIARDQLRLAREQIQRLSADGWSLSKDDDTWNLTGADNEGQLDQAKVEALLTTLANLSYREMLGTEAPDGFDLAAPTLALEIGLADGDNQRYLIAPRLIAPRPIADQPGDTEGSEDAAGASAGGDTAVEEDFVLKVEGRPYYFLLSDFDLGPLLGLDASKLLKAPQPTDPAASDSPSAAGSAETTASPPPEPSPEPSSEPPPENDAM